MDLEKRKRAEGAPVKRRRKAQPFKLRVRIVAACALREVTPQEIATEERLRLATAHYYFNALEKEDWIYVARREPVGGAWRKWYRAKRLKLITDREFEQMGAEQRHETSEGILLHYLGICKVALQEGTLDARADSHLSHTPMDLDQEGWGDLQHALDRTLERSLEITVEAAMRLRKSGEEPIPTLVHLGGFEVPPSVTEGARAKV